MVRRHVIVESDEYESEGGMELSCNRSSSSDCSSSRDRSSPNQDLVVIPCNSVADPYEGVRRKGYYPADKSTPAGYIGKSLKILSKNPPSSFTLEDLARFKELYGLPIGARICAPIGEQRVDWEVPRGVFMYEKAFKIGLRLPLPSFVMEVLGHFKIAPSQLMPNSWRILLGFQVLREVRKVEASFEAFRYSYFLAKHKSERGRITINIRSGMEPLIPTRRSREGRSWKERYLLLREEYVFGPEGSGEVPLFWQDGGTIDNSFPEELIPLAQSQVREILGVPWSKRHSLVLLTSKLLAKTSIWSACIALSGLSATEFVQNFEEMEKSRSIPLPRTADILGRCAGAKRVTKKPKVVVAGTSIVPVGSSGTTTPTKASSKRGKAAETVQLIEECKQVDLGNGIAISVDPSSFVMKGNFRLTEDISSVRDGGPSMMVGYALSHLVKGLQAMAALNDDIGSSDRKCKELESSIRRLKGELASLKTAKAESEEKASKRLKQAEDELQKKNDEIWSLHSDMTTDLEVAALMARRDLLVEVSVGDRLPWDPLDEIASVDAAVEMLRGGNGVEVVDAGAAAEASGELGVESPMDDPDA